MTISFVGCRWESAGTIAVIPRTSGTMLWEPEHGGADTAAHAAGMKVYWNAPTREDDIAAQINLVESVTQGKFRGLILAPDQALALMTPVRRALARGLPTVIVSSPLSIPPGGKLSYVLNDDEAGGRIAAERVATLLHGRGSVMILGMNPDISGIMIRARSLETLLHEKYPDIDIVDRRAGTFNMPHEQQVAEEALRAHPGVGVIVALMWSSTMGALSTVDSNHMSHPIKVIGFDPNGFPLQYPSLDSLIAQDTRQMGSLAVADIVAELQGAPTSPVIRLAPVLVTRDNINSERIKNLFSTDWGSKALTLDSSESR
ncbi:MAG: substrate-binding domain-containing protein [Acidobacteriota bacterium]|nr:substrate-binding domain-containing protein [Acidobacteriota bacterium]